MSPLQTDHKLPIETLQDRLQHIKDCVSRAAKKSGRETESVLLVAVTKNVGVEIINQAVSLGLGDFGENRLQEALEKRPGVVKKTPSGSAVRHHFIGHLQTNKARKVVENFDLIQSVDSERLAEALNRISVERGVSKECLLEVKISPEPTKSGMPRTEVEPFLEKLGLFPALKFIGLMTIAPYGLKETETREYFSGFRRLFEKTRSVFGTKPVLSMGMSDDFEIAVEEGATLIRVGRALFGERK